MGYYSALKKKLPMHATTRVRLETCQVKGARRKRAHTAFYMKLYSGEKITIVFASAGVEADWEGA